VSDSIGHETIGQPDETITGASEQEIAASIARAIDALSEVAQYLPIDTAVMSRLRASLHGAWLQLLEDVGVCNDDDLLDEGESGEGWASASADGTTLVTELSE